MADLPDISPDFAQDLPQVDPNSDLVPYRMSRTDPGQQPVVTTGYGPRARPPIQPPGGGGVGVPDMTGFLGEAMQHLPVDEALRATEAATRFIGQRGYMREIQSGANAAQAFAKWGPMLFRQATGIPEAIDRSVPTPITPQQLIQNKLNQAKFDAAQEAAKAKALAATQMTPYQEASLALRKQAMEAKPPPTDETVTEEYQTKPVKAQAARAAQAASSGLGFLGIGAHPALPAVPAVEAQPAKTIKQTRKLRSGEQANFAPKETQAAPTPVDLPNPAQPQGAQTVTTKAQYDALPSGAIYIGKDGKRYKKP